MCMSICTFTNLNTNACDQKKLMLKIFLPYLQLLIENISFVSLHVFHIVKVITSAGK
jgi:hypothetical protein